MILGKPGDVNGRFLFRFYTSNDIITKFMTKFITAGIQGLIMSSGIFLITSNNRTEPTSLIDLLSRVSSTQTLLLELSIGNSRNLGGVISRYRYFSIQINSFFVFIVISS
ncbi:MAG: hypothetical protein QN229_03485 [Desulfurococcaceae archaeon TW002]